MSIRFNYQEATLRICVDDMTEARFSGRVFGQRLREPITFSDLNTFVAQVDALLDTQRFPQAYQQIRSFTDRESPAVPAVMDKGELSDLGTVNAAEGAVMTFSLLILSRQNACWQGRVDWLDGSPQTAFASALELIHAVETRRRSEDQTN